MDNKKLANIFSELAALLEIQGVKFKPRAFERAAYSIESLEYDVAEIYKKGGLKVLEEIPGVGEGIAERIEEYIKTGGMKEYEKLKKKLPIDVSGLMKIEGVGPKLIKKLYQRLKIKNQGDLKKLAQAGKLRQIEGLGEKSERKILKSIGFLEQSSGRLLLGYALPVARKMLESLRLLAEVEKVEIAGSIRRMQETIGDFDMLAISSKPRAVIDFFVSMPEVQAVHSKGPTRTSVRLKIGVDADLQVVPPGSFGAALQYFTGDKYHNIAVREMAARMGYKLNEYGLFSAKSESASGGKGKKSIAAGTEKEIYEMLGMSWMEPELRTDSGEIEASQKNKLPKLIGYGDLKGDLQVQTNWTDGENSIEEMAEAAKKQGLEYILITDHTKSLAMAGGADEEKLEKQMAEIDKIQKKFDGIKILKGAEVNIKKDGALDIDDKTLAKLDVVGAAVHSNFNMSEKEMTARIVKAMENPHVDIIFHPTGRLIQKREPYKVDMDTIVKTAKRTKTVLEIDAFPDRLDLKDEFIRKAVNAGVKLSISSDAHSIEHFRYLELGVAQARRGWAEKKDVINAHSWQEMLRLLK